MKIVSKIQYAENQLNNFKQLKKHNLLGNAIQSFDQSGKTIINQNGIINKSQTTQIIKDYVKTIDWTTSSPNTLLDDVYTSSAKNNAESNIFEETLPGQMGIIKNQFNEIGLLDNTQIKLKGQNDFNSILSNIQYNELLQIESKTLGCNVSTTFNYDKDTQKLININNSHQNLNYTFDPIGNVIQIDEKLKYNYNPFYELINAKGSHHNSVSLNTHKTQYNLKSYFKPLYNMFNIHDEHKLEQYNISYNYDNSGNMKARNLTSPSLQIPLNMSIDTKSNRLLNNCNYDKCGNSQMLKDKNLNWDFMNNLKSCENKDFKEYYVYSGRQRIRKVKTDLAGNIIEEKLYIGNYEIKIDKKNGRRDGIKIGNYLILHNFEKDNIWLYRYLLTNNIHSVSLELNEKGEEISYEEYYPYGGSSYHSKGEGYNKKEFGWVGQEKDEFSGFIYFGARYYCTCICRWINPDPGGTVDGLNIWIYVNSNPITYFDVGGYGKCHTCKESMGCCGLFHTCDLEKIRELEAIKQQQKIDLAEAERIKEEEEIQKKIDREDVFIKAFIKKKEITTDIDLIDRFTKGELTKEDGRFYYDFKEEIRGLFLLTDENFYIEKHDLWRGIDPNDETHKGKIIHYEPYYVINLANEKHFRNRNKDDFITKLQGAIDAKEETHNVTLGKWTNSRFSCLYEISDEDNQKIILNKNITPHSKHSKIYMINVNNNKEIHEYTTTDGSKFSINKLFNIIGTPQDSKLSLAKYNDLDGPVIINLSGLSTFNNRLLDPFPTIEHKI